MIKGIYISSSEYPACCEVNGVSPSAMIHLSESSAIAKNSPKELLNKGCSFPVPKRLLSITSSLLYKLKSLLKY